jgi:uncharacterized protein YfaS (alpha-2-macroglobulin family)
MTPTHKTGRVLLALFGLLLSMGAALGAPRRDANHRQRSADRDFAEKSYARALAEYRQALRTLPAGAPQRTQIEYRVAVALEQTQKWDDAGAALTRFLAAQRGDLLWTARADYELGLLRSREPHMGYKVGGRVYRGSDYPHTDSADRPEYSDLSLGDLQAAQAAMEAAVRAFERVPTAQRQAAAREETDLCFDLAKTVAQAQPWGSKADWKAARTTDWTVDAARPYDTRWPAPKKVLALLARISRQAAADTHTIVRAQLARALYVAQAKNGWARGEFFPAHHFSGRPDRPGGWRIVQRIPYAGLDPAAMLTQTAAQYPADPQAPQMRLIVAQWAEQAGRFASALAQYRALAGQYPRSRWAPDARAAISRIQRPTLSLTTPGPQHVGSPAVVSVASRNLTALTLHVYRLPLNAILTSPRHLDNPANSFTDFHGNFGGLRDAAARFGTPVAAWTVTPHPRAAYAPVEGQTVRVPVTQRGAYLVIAQGDGGRTRAAAIVLLSDLTVVRQMDRDHIQCFVADARSGRPVTGAAVVVRQTYEQDSHRHVQVLQGRTDAMGVWTAPRFRRTDIEPDTIEAFASAPGARYALTGADGGWYGDGDDGQGDSVKVYAYTDRPVYRPGQQVSFRVLLAKRRGGSDFAPLTGVPVTVTTHDSHGGQVSQTTVTSGEFGSVSGSFKLASGAPLGEYAVSVQRADKKGDGDDLGGAQFRVEEYKKPEYLVTVTPSTPQARFGDRVTATVHGVYYSGPPAAGARVSYHVYRSPFSPEYHFPQPYDWLYQSDEDQDNTGEDPESGELVTQGHGVLDDKGDLAVAFTALKGTRGYAGDYAYTVKADVVDSSRRQISGTGVLKVARQQFFAYLHLPDAFYQQNDIAQVEVRTEDANNQPVSSSGTLTVSRLTPGPGGKEFATPVYTLPVATDADGKAFATWRAPDCGRFRVAWAARDRYGAKVAATAPLWIDGPGLTERRFHIGGVTLLTDKRTYEEGETAHLLILADKPDAWVLLAQETGDEILSHTLYHVAGRSRTVDVPIVRAHVPNFAFTAVAVRDYQCYQWHQEVFVPPSRQFTHMTVTGDKAEYRPGDTGTFRIHATDAQGRPARSEVSLAVIDSSVYAIQPEYAPDIRLFFYGQRRSVDVNVDSSLETDTPTRDESDLPTSHDKPHGIVLPDFGRLPGGFDVPYYGDTGLDPKGYTIGHSVWAYGTQMAGSAGGGGMPAFGGAPGSISADMESSRVVPKPMASLPPNPNRRSDSIDGAGGFPPSHMVPFEERQTASFKPARVRNFFPDTAFWTPAVVTSPTDGEATLTVKFPDTLTTWHAVARGLTTGVQVGAADTDVITDKHLLVRLEAPRFFVERDQVTLSAIVRNDLATAKTVRVSLTTAPDVLQVGATPEADPVRTITVPAHAEQRVDWTAQVVGSGPASVKMTAETDEESDAVSQTFPALAYGVQKFVAQSGVLPDGPQTAHLTLDIPAEHRAGTAALLVQITPSLAATALDALPYLADYPYGCVEQTMSRFLPSVIVAKTLRDSGVDLDTLHQRAQALAAREQAGTPFGQTSETTADTDQTGYTYPTGTPGVMKTPELAEGLDHSDRWDSPIFDPERLNAMAAEGLARLLSMQRPDGGWGWWPDSTASDPYMTAYVVYGLRTAQSAGIAVPADVLRRGDAYLTADLKTRDDQRDLAVWEAFALSQTGRLSPESAHVVGVAYAQRDRLTVYGQALLALTLHDTGRNAEAQVVCRNMENTVTIDRASGTATWRPRTDFWWQWEDDNVETTAWALRAYLAVSPGSEITPMLAQWLVQNRRGNQWNSTKETAMVVYALSDDMRVNHELAPDQTVTIALGDKVTRTYTINRDDALLFDNRFLVPDTLLASGPQTVTISKQGTGRLYYSSALQYVTTEESIQGAGQELQVQRRYFRLTPRTKSVPDALGGTYPTQDYTRTELHDGAALKSGDLIDVDLTLDSHNAYDYCCVEDMKPAGCEPLDQLSGYQAGDTLWSDRELRDTKTVFFIDHLRQGTQVLRYRLRAEVPGQFHALPANAYALYAPDVRALSDNWHVGISDGP